MAPSLTGSPARVAPREPLMQWAAIAGVMLSQSIGWGIRGNYGHEAGAMIAGALSGLALCLFSGREDWRRRAPFFAMFGALGWAFGGSMAYMPTISYTHSGHWPTQLYGWFAVFAIGGLWTAMGAAGVAFAAVESRERLDGICRPLCWVLAIWAIQYFWPANSGDFRQRDPLYWLDSDWVEAILAIAALCAFELWDRRFRGSGTLLAFTAGGALAGFALQRGIEAAGWMPAVLQALVRYQGDTTNFDPANLLTNWPQIFADLGLHLGWILGGIASAVVWFVRRGRWRSGSSLLMHIACGSMIVFIALPVLLGVRMVPPRGDSWAMTLGALIGTVVYMRRNRLPQVATAAISGLVLGGVGFMLAQFVKLIALMPGNPLLTQDPATIAAWAHWRSANWHSIMAEQGAGLLYGLALLLAVRPLAAMPEHDERGRKRWTEIFAVAFVLNLLVYLNLVRNMSDWTRERAGGYRTMPLSLKAPLAGFELSALGWFNVFFALVTAATIVLLIVHVRRGIAMVPASWIGRAQMLYLVYLWIMVAANFARQLGAFTDGRLATEGFITVNAIIVTMVVLLFATDAVHDAGRSAAISTLKMLAAGAATVAVLACVFTGIMQSVYGARHDGFGGRNIRFGPEADWRVRPLLKNVQHR